VPAPEAHGRRERRKHGRGAVRRGRRGGRIGAVRVLASHRARVRAALRAAAFRLVGPFVRAALRAAAARSVGDRRFEAVRAWRDSERSLTVLRGSRSSAPSAARARLRETFLRGERAFSRAACFFTSGDAFFDAGSFTPARRALERPIAIACLVERAPCLPWRMCSISSRTNSPACVLAALPCRLSRAARSMVFLSGTVPPDSPAAVCCGGLQCARQAPAIRNQGEAGTVHAGREGRRTRTAMCTCAGNSATFRGEARTAACERSSGALGQRVRRGRDREWPRG
jgi:hypothetical protein